MIKNFAFSSRLLASTPRRIWIPPRPIPIRRVHDVAALPQISEPTLCKLYIDNVFPIKYGRFDIRWVFAKRYSRMLEDKSEHLLPREFPNELSIVSFDPMVKEGGVFLFFKYHGKVDEALDLIRTHMEGVDRSFLTLLRPKLHVVHGNPFVEDIVARNPSSRLKLAFPGEMPSTESLYALFRPYGVITDIVVQPPVKDVPRLVHVQFQRIRAATSAKNCVHGLVLEGDRGGKAKLDIQYEPTLGANAVWEGITSHPRISLPILLAIATLLSYLIFDPLRIFCVSNKITQKYAVKLSDNALYRRLEKLITKNYFGLMRGKDKHEDDEDDVHVWEEREKEVAQLTNLLKEVPETFILISGPTGSGKTKLVKKALQLMPYQLIINCEELVNAPDDSSLLKKLADQVGYFPLMTLMNSGWVEAAIGAATGGLKQPSTLSSSNDANATKILETVALSLLNIQKDMDEGEPLPVIVIKGFLNKKGKHKYIYDALANWAGFVVENHVAHVVFLSSSQEASRVLSKALPNKTVVALAVSDASLESSIAYITDRLGASVADLPVTNQVLRLLGGRLLDLELFVNKVQAGCTVLQAFNELVSRNVSEIRKHGFYDDQEMAQTQWTSPQLWLTISTLASQVRPFIYFCLLISLSHFCFLLQLEIFYDALRFHALFKGDESPIRALEAAGIITILHEKGRPYIIKPGKPLYLAAFDHLCSDKKLKASMEVLCCKDLIDGETAKIIKCENEIRECARSIEGQMLPHDVRKALDDRLSFLRDLLIESHEKVLKLDKERREWNSELKLR